MAVIPAKRGRRNPSLHGRDKYRQRSRVEQLFNNLQNWRDIATRYDQIRETCFGFVSRDQRTEKTRGLKSQAAGYSAAERAIAHPTHAADQFTAPCTRRRPAGPPR